MSGSYLGRVKLNRRLFLILMYSWLLMNPDPSYARRSVGGMVLSKLYRTTMDQHFGANDMVYRQGGLFNTGLGEGLRSGFGGGGGGSGNGGGGGLSTVEAIALIQAINSNKSPPSPPASSTSPTSPTTSSTPDKPSSSNNQDETTDIIRFRDTRHRNRSRLSSVLSRQFDHRQQSDQRQLTDLQNPDRQIAVRQAPPPVPPGLPAALAALVALLTAALTGLTPLAALLAILAALLPFLFPFPFPFPPYPPFPGQPPFPNYPIIKKLIIKKTVLPFVIPFPYKKKDNDKIVVVHTEKHHGHHHHEHKYKHKSDHHYESDFNEDRSDDQLSGISQLVDEQHQIQSLSDELLNPSPTIVKRTGLIVWEGGNNQTSILRQPKPHEAKAANSTNQGAR